TVERHGRREPLDGARSGKSERPAHAKSNCGDLAVAAPVRPDERRCLADFGHGSFLVELHHRLRGLLLRGRTLAMKQVWRNRDEARLREAVAQRFDMIAQSPPLVDDDEAPRL